MAGLVTVLGLALGKCGLEDEYSGGGSVAGLVTVLGLAVGKCGLEDEYSGGRISGGACNHTRSSVR